MVFFGSKSSDASSASSSSELNYYDYLIVGSGLYDAIFTYLSKKAGKTTFVVEKLKVIGGNLYCENQEGIFIHKYGSHIFHTDNKKILDFVNSLTHFKLLQIINYIVYLSICGLIINYSV